MTHTVARGINMDGRLCVAFDQPDVKEEKNSHSLFYFGMAFDGAVCVWPVSDLYSTKTG
jgi:hypothetical protein